MTDRQTMSCHSPRSAGKAWTKNEKINPSQITILTENEYSTMQKVGKILEVYNPERPILNQPQSRDFGIAETAGIPDLGIQSILTITHILAECSYSFT